jgi:hypothetical protein
MRTRARGIADFRNDTGQPASAFGGGFGVRIADSGQPGGGTAPTGRQASCTKQTQLPEAGHRGGVRLHRGGRGRGPWGNRAKQSQFPSDPKEGQVLCGKGVMVNRTFDRPQQNKPNSRPGRVGRGPGDGGRRIIAQNKPNCPKRGTEAVSCRGPAVWGRRGVRRGANAPNKPNLPGASGRDKYCAGKELW